MRKLVLYIAMSLDGYIADAKGGVGWLHGQKEGADDMSAYADFVREVDTVLMGWNTYRQVVTELAVEGWPYSGLVSYVFTHRRKAPEENIIFTRKDPCSVVQELKQQPGKNIWLCGGSCIVRQLHRADMVDVYHISVIPMLLGGGVALFGDDGVQIPLRLRSTRSDNGILELVYDRR